MQSIPVNPIFVFIWLKITNIFNSRVDKIVKDATTINASLSKYF